MNWSSSLKLKAGEWFTSSLNGMKAVQPPGQLESSIAWTAWKLAKKFIEAHKQGSVASETQPTQVQFVLTLKVIGWPGLACKTNHVRLSKGTDQSHSQIAFHSFFSWAFIGTREGLFTPRCYAVSFPDHIFYTCQKNRFGELPIPFSFKCAGMLAHCSFLI